jgi:hypothetical protein
MLAQLVSCLDIPVSCAAAASGGDGAARLTRRAALAQETLSVDVSALSVGLTVANVANVTLSVPQLAVGHLNTLRNVSCCGRSVGSGGGGVRCCCCYCCGGGCVGGSRGALRWPRPQWLTSACAARSCAC